VRATRGDQQKHNQRTHGRNPAIKTREMLEQFLPLARPDLRASARGY